jgi:hypothetical protein
MLGYGGLRGGKTGMRALVQARESFRVLKISRTPQPELEVVDDGLSYSAAEIEVRLLRRPVQSCAPRVEGTASGSRCGMGVS